jgi:hypothetical protein
VGKYAAFEEIDLAEYLAVRDRAVRIIAGKDPYAGLLIALHTYNLLTAHADRATIAAAGLMLLDEFLVRQRAYQAELLSAIATDPTLTPLEKSEQTILDHFRLLQACDNLSLLSCVAYSQPAHLLHPLPLKDGSTLEVKVFPVASRHFRLSPWPFAGSELTFQFPAKHVEGRVFGSSAELEERYSTGEEMQLCVTLHE